MPLCGFNSEMLQGLEAFHKGLFEHGIVERSLNKKSDEKTVISTEIKEMNLFLNETHGINDENLRDLVENLTKYARAFYKILENKGLNQNKIIIQFLTDFYFNMDKKYYSELEDSPDRMKLLVSYLNNFGGKNATKRI